jgi:hydrogenase maturation protease
MNSAVPERRAMVIGCGNPLRGDDAAGPVVVERLREELEAIGVGVIACHQLLPEMAEPISRCRTAIVVDASVELAPGEVRAREVEPTGGQNGFVHAFDPPGLLWMARRLYGAAPRMHLVAVGGGTWDRPDQLSPEVEAAVGLVMNHVRRLLSTAR